MKNFFVYVFSLLLCIVFLSSCTVVKNDEAQIETKKPSIAAETLSTEGSKVPQLSGDTMKMNDAKSEISETVKAELQKNMMKPQPWTETLWALYCNLHPMKARKRTNMPNGTPTP